MGLLKFVGKKLLMMIPMLLLISFIVFAGLQATGIDPINYMITPDMAANAENIELLRESLGLNDPFIVRYFHWIRDIVTGNLGYSIVNGSSISSLLATRLPATFELALAALILSSLLGISIGIISAIRQNGIVDTREESLPFWASPSRNSSSASVSCSFLPSNWVGSLSAAAFHRVAGVLWTGSCILCCPSQR